MSTVTRSHPTPTQLADFNAGRASPVVTDEIATHLEGCHDCPETLSTMPPGPLEDRVRSAGVMACSTGKPELAKALNGHPRYKVCDEPQLGSGGQSVVVKARDMPFPGGRIVAVKLIREESAQRFLPEVKGGTHLRHANIAPILDAGVYGGVCYLVMELLKGSDLNRLVKHDGPLPVIRACSYVQQAARGLQHAHEEKLVHRDIKPANLLASPDGWVTILDFGLVRILDEVPDAESITQGCVIGTPAYMAPEQAKNAHQADIRSDIYSLGCTLYYLLSGRVPFPRETVVQVLMAHQLETPVPVTKFRADVPQGLVAVLNKMMAKNPAKRFQTPAEVAEALAPFVTPRPPLPAWIKLAVAAVAACLLVVSFGTYLLLTWASATKEGLVDAGKEPPLSAGQTGTPPPLTRSETLTKGAWNEFKKGETIIDENSKLSERLKATAHFAEAIRLAKTNIAANFPEATGMQKGLDSSKVVIPKAGKVPDDISQDQKQRIHQNWAVNDISSCLFIEGRSLEYIVDLNRDSRLEQDSKDGSKKDQGYAQEEREKLSLAQAAYAKAKTLSHGRCWDPDGSHFWNPPKTASDRLDELAKSLSK